MALFPSVEPAMKAAREYLCSREEVPALLDEFERAVASLNVPAAQTREGVRAHAERMQNEGRIPVEAVAGFRVRLESYALGHYARMLDLLAVRFVAGEGDPARKAKLLDVVSMAKARG